MLRTHYVSQLNAGLNGKDVTVAGWVHEVRDIGKIVFMLLRDSTGIVQVTAKKGSVGEGVLRDMNLPKESVVSVTGMVKVSHEARAGFEIVPHSVHDLNPLLKTIPFEVTGKVPADLDVRLDHRHIDLRRRETSAIFSIEHTILSSFRDSMTAQGFMEIRPPSIVEESTEGGADLFQIKYFEKNAYLAQSPQLYKQLAVIGGMDRIFMVTAIFRAEKHNTTYHLNESTQMDVEMGFADHNDAIGALKKTIADIFERVSKDNQEDLAALGSTLRIPKIVEVTYTDAIKILKDKGAAIEFGTDFGRTEEEALCSELGEMVLVKGYPTALRAFYTMPSEDDPRVSNSFDLLYKGLEILSGAQRIHRPEMLLRSIKDRGMNEDDFGFYIDAFKEGAPPHAGWSIGLERLAMRMTGKDNIRECSMFPRDRNRLVP